MAQVPPRKRPAKTPSPSALKRGAAVPPTIQANPYTVNATQAKNQFGAILRRVRTAAPVFIEKHGAAQAVVLDIGSYRTLVHKAREPEQVQLDVLREEFDALYARMQSPESRNAVDLLSSASADELNRVAASRAKRRG
jgi:prevent-host-death family protein